jgi:hypothetical protein
MKFGYKARAVYPANTTVTFSDTSSAFPAAVISAQATGVYNGAAEYSTHIVSFSTSTLVMGGSSGITGYYWQAWGY